MRATDQQVIALFSGERIAPGCRGRRSGLQHKQVNKRTSRHLAIVFGALLIGCTSAATAFTVHQSAVPARSIVAGANLSVPVHSLHLASAVW
jgi:hypothetical protein